VYIHKFNEFVRINEAFDARTQQIQSALKAKGQKYAVLLGTSGPNKDGVDGEMGRSTDRAIRQFQKDNELTPDGVVGELTAAKLGISASSTNSVPNQPDTKWILSAPTQVKQQIEYLQSIKFNKSFTVVDDRNSKVYAVNSDYSLNKVYDVITGKNRGDELVTKTFGDWLKEKGLLDSIKKTMSTFWSEWWDKDKSFGDAAATSVGKIEGEYLDTELKTMATPAGVFKRQAGLGSWLNDVVLTFIAEKVYGKKFISWETLDGKEIPFGFHGTQKPERINLEDDDFSKTAYRLKRKMSYGCINFKEADILEINKFIKGGQYSFWLPNASTGIVRINSGASGSF
jgi:hypothetical protein